MYGVCECKHAISNTPKEKNHTKVRESEGATARLRNGKWGARETQTCSAQQAKSPLLLKWPTQRKRMPTTSSPHPPGLPTEYYPFKTCQVPVGHSVCYWTSPLCFCNSCFSFGTSWVPIYGYPGTVVILLNCSTPSASRRSPPSTSFPMHYPLIAVNLRFSAPDYIP